MSARAPLLLLATLGCSASNISITPCQASSECRDAFGLGWVCGDQGTCTELDEGNRCDQPYPSDLFTNAEAHTDDLVIGALFDFQNQLENLRSIELAIDEANIEGGLDGRPIALAACNYAENLDLDADDSATAANRLTTWLAEDLGVQVVLGPGSSPKVEQIWETSSTLELLLIAPSATSDRLTRIDGETSTDEDPGLFWRTAPPDIHQARTIAEDIVSRNVASVAIIHQSGAYGEGLADGIEVALPGGLVQAVRPYDNPNQLTAAIADTGNTTVEEVVFISSEPADVAAFLNGAAATGDFATKNLFLTDSARDQGVLDQATNAQALFPNIRGSVPVPDPTVAGALEDTFYLAYAQRYGVDANRDGFNTFAYDAAWLALYGLAWSTTQLDSTAGIDVARGLRQLSTPGIDVPVRAASWLDVQSQLGQGTAIDVYGASGTLDFDPVTGETSNPIALWIVEDDGGTYGFTNILFCPPDGSCTPI